MSDHDGYIMNDEMLELVISDVEKERRPYLVSALRELQRLREAEQRAARSDAPRARYDDGMRVALSMIERALASNIDGHDRLARLEPMHWHYANIKVRTGGRDFEYEGDWLKDLYRALQDIRRQLGLLPPATPPKPRVGQYLQDIEGGWSGDASCTRSRTPPSGSPER